MTRDAGPREAAPLLVVEPTYADWDHATVNGAFLRAARLAFADAPITFAAAGRQMDTVLEAYPDLRALGRRAIDVPPPGGISRARFLAQLRAIRGGIRATGARTVLLLSGGPETFFAARLLVSLDAGLRLFIVLHGLSPRDFTWRSRDPRRRFFDYRAGMAWARHPRIRFVALEQHIAQALPALLAMDRAPLTWPHPLPDDCPPDDGARAVSSPVRIAFPGTAHSNKGFAVFESAARRFASPALDFELVGYNPVHRTDNAAVAFRAPTAPLPRGAYVERLRGADYAMLPLREDVYRLTASGSMMDCIALRLPLMTTPNDAVLALEREFGPVGFIFRDEAELAALLARPQTLADPARHAAFRAALARAAGARDLASLAGRIRRDLMG